VKNTFESEEGGEGRKGKESSTYIEGIKGVMRIAFVTVGVLF